MCTPDSPEHFPTPLHPRPASKRNSPSFVMTESAPLFSTADLQRQSFLSPNTDPIEALCRHFNVAPAHWRGHIFPPTFDMNVVQNAQMPTHVLALYDTPEPSPGYTIMAPIHADLYVQKFRSADLVPLPPTGTIAPVPHSPSRPQQLIVTLPVVPVAVPHAPSIPLLLVFGLGLEFQLDLMGWRLLPPEVIEEFPNAPAMAAVMARVCSDEQLLRYVVYNQGLWKNILALGPKDMKVVKIAQTAWNVTVEARRIRQRRHAFG